MRIAFAALCAFAALAPVSAFAQQKGGTVVVVDPGTPNTLDCHFNGIAVGRSIQVHWCESLVTIDENSSIIPMLAESWKVADDGLSVTFKLREGVKFHDGSVMTSADVKASLERYKRVSPNKAVLASVESVDATAEDEVVLRLSKPRPSLVDEMASPASPMAIYPARLCDAEAGKIENIGTGPYKFLSYEADSNVEMVRFDEYSQNMAFEGPTGLGGKKTPYFDKVRFEFIPEPSAQAAALETDRVQVVTSITAATAKRLEALGTVNVKELMPFGMQWLQLNIGLPPTDNVLIRQAIVAALNMEEAAGISNQGVFRLNPTWLYPENQYYPGEVGAELYNQNNPEKGKQLLAEAGYKGEPVTLMLSPDRLPHYDAGIVIERQLKAIGLNVKVVTYDWPTVLTYRETGEIWNMIPSGTGIEPYLGVYGGFERIFSGPNNLYNSKDTSGQDAAWAKLMSATEASQRAEAAKLIGEQLWKDLGYVKLADYGLYQATTAKVENYKPYRMPRMWDVWFK